jgi:SRSO17 transposase
MVERVPESNYQQLQHFISESEWDARAVMKEVAKNTNLSLESLSGEKGLIIGRKRERAKQGLRALEWHADTLEMSEKCAIRKMEFMPV